MNTDDFNPYRPPEADLAAPDSFIDPADLRPVPFEDIEFEPGFWRRVGAMFSMLFKEPLRLAERVPVTRGLGAPWRFQMLLCIPMYLFMLLYVAVIGFVGLMAYLAPKTSHSDAPPAWLFIVIAVGILVLVPIFQFLGTMMAGLLNHGCLWIWGGLRQGQDLNVTLRATSYYLAFLMLAGWIPCLGMIITLAAPAMFGIALARIHRTDTWRGICAAYTPILACCLAYGVFFAIMIAATSAH